MKAIGIILVLVCAALSFYFGYSVRDSNARKEIEDAKVLGATVFCLDIGDENGNFIFETDECPQLVNTENAANAFATPLAWYQDRGIVPTPSP